MVKSAMTLLKELIDSIQINETGTRERDKKTTVTRRRSLSSLTNIHENDPLSSSKRTIRYEGLSKARYEGTERFCTASVNHQSQTKKTHSLIFRNSSRCSNTELSHRNKMQPSKKNAYPSRIPKRIKAKGNDLGVEEIHEVLDKMLKTIKEVPSATCREPLATKNLTSQFIRNNISRVPIQGAPQLSTANKKEKNFNKTYIRPLTPSEGRRNFSSTKLTNNLTPSSVHSNVPNAFISNEKGLGVSKGNSGRTDHQKPFYRQQISGKQAANSLGNNYDSRDIKSNSNIKSNIPTKSCEDVCDKDTKTYKKQTQKNIEKNKEEFTKYGMVPSALPRDYDLDLSNSQKNNTTSSKLLKSMTRSKKFESTHLECLENSIRQNTPELYIPRIRTQYFSEKKNISDENYAEYCDDLADVGSYEEFVADRLNRRNNGNKTLFENVLVGKYEDFERDLLNKDQRRLRGLINSMFESGNMILEKKTLRFNT